MLRAPWYIPVPSRYHPDTLVAFKQELANAQITEIKKGQCAGWSAWVLQILLSERAGTPVVESKLFYLKEIMNKGIYALGEEDTKFLKTLIYIITEQQENQSNIETGALFDNPGDAPKQRADIVAPFNKDY